MATVLVSSFRRPANLPGSVTDPGNSQPMHLTLPVIIIEAGAVRARLPG